MKTFRALALAFACAIVTAAQSAPSAYWTITDLGGASWNVIANTVDNRGEVAGWMRPDNGPFHDGFLWSNGTLADIGSAHFGATGSSVSGMNNHGMLVGDDGVHPTIYQDGTWIVLPVQGTLNDANESNIAVGAMAFGPTPHAFMYKEGAIIDLGAPPGGSASAFAINNHGVVAGTANLPGSIYSWPPPSRAFVFENGEMSLLDTLGGNQGFGADINNAGVIAGTAQDAAGAYHAVVYEGGIPRSLGIPGIFSGAKAINDRGQVIGSVDNGSFLYDNGTVTVLDSIPEVAAAGWTHLQARAINDRGWIAGTGLRNGQGRAFVLKPD